MSLPPQDVLDGINELITTVTGFEETDENFEICQRYCLSHVIHHTYPFVNRTSVQNLFNNYVSRFYGHGYFKVAQELHQQVKSFLGNTNVFEKNTQYDIQWCLLSLVSALSTNLTSVKDVPNLLPIDEEEVETDDINWHEYLTQDLPRPIHLDDVNSESDTTYTEDENENFEDGGKGKDNQNEGSSFDREDKANCTKTETESLNQDSCQNTKAIDVPQITKASLESEHASSLRKMRIEQLLSDRKLIGDIDHDYMMRGNICEKFDQLLSNIGFSKKSQILSELELMEYILCQFQTGQKILLKKGLLHPALISVTQITLGNYLESLQPYFQIIRCFKDFDDEIMKLRYPDLCSDNKSNQSPRSKMRRQKIPNVLYIYSIMLRKALTPFQNEILNIADNMYSHTLIQMQQKIQSHFFELTSLFYVHGKATKNWKRDSNWMCSLRILSVLHNAIMDATTVKMCFLYLNIFLHCFQVYLDTIDSWISFLNFNDPTDEFLVTSVRSANSEYSDSHCAELEIRPYKEELENAGIKEVPILDYIAKKMSHVGQSLEVLRRLGRFVEEDSKTSSYERLINKMEAKIRSLGRVTSPRVQVKPQEKKRSIFTMSNLTVGLTRDNGIGDHSVIDNLMDELKEEKRGESATATAAAEEEVTRCQDHCMDLVRSTIKNPFFKRAFENVGLEYQMKRLEAAKARGSEEGEFGLEVIKQPVGQEYTVYPYRKIIFECSRDIIGTRVSSACELVKNIVMKECNLSSHLSLFRSVLLFNDSYLIQPFILTFFTQPVVWNSSHSLTAHLKECLEARYGDLASLVTVSVTKDFSTAEKNVLQAIDAITVNCQVQWPLTVIFTPDAMMKYNNIFRLAMKLKWSHWILSNLYFQKENKSTSPLLRSNYHRLQILRFWFLGLLGFINNYFMAQMNAVNLELESCADLKDIIRIHSKLIDKIHGDCLLGDKSPDVWSVIFRTLIPLCIDLEKHWQEENVVAKAKLAEMETVFANCQVHISRMFLSMERK